MKQLRSRNRYHPPTHTRALSVPRTIELKWFLSTLLATLWFIRLLYCCRRVCIIVNINRRKATTTTIVITIYFNCKIYLVFHLTCFIYIYWKPLLYCWVCVCVAGGFARPSASYSLHARAHARTYVRQTVATCFMHCTSVRARALCWNMKLYH